MLQKPKQQSSTVPSDNAINVQQFSMKELEVNCNKNSAVGSCHEDAADWTMLMEDYFEKVFQNSTTQAPAIRKIKYIQIIYFYCINILSKIYCSMTDRKMVMQYAATRARIVIKKRNLSCMSK